MTVLYGQLSWLRTATGVAVRTADQVIDIPEEFTAGLIRPDGIGLSADPADDLARLEALLRRALVDIQAMHRAAETVISTLHEDLTAAGEVRGLRGLRERRDIIRRLNLAAVEHATISERLALAAGRVQAIRAFITDLRVPDGLLADLAAGWAINPDRPEFITEFADEDTFLVADTRRGVSSEWGATVLDSEPFGDGWRRDPDDDPTAGDDELGLAGPWQLRYLPRTGEVYASRHSGIRPTQVWLLGRRFFDADAIRWVLTDLQQWMRRPNSLILAARTVHHTQRSVADRPHAPPSGAPGHPAGAEHGNRP
jgi:hypothetical protein